jgi:molybdopterin molybdotransferase
MISVEDAFQRLAEQVTALPGQRTDLSDAVGRVLVENVASDVDSPPHRKSVMDGFAVRSDDLLQGALSPENVDNGNRRLKVIETIVAGAWPQFALAAGEAARIMTGAPLPETADAVVMIEDTRQEKVDGQDWVIVETESVPPGKHLMEQASNFSKGDIVLQAGHRIRPADIGLLAEVGASSFFTGSRPTVAVLPTGDELVGFEQQPGVGQIRNSNGPMLVAMAKQMGLPVTDLGIGRDMQSDLASKIQAGLMQDVLILSGGVSAGLMDLVPRMLSDAGVEEIFHQVAIKPGKPIWFGVQRGAHRCVVFGLPGNPVSSLVGFHLFVRTAIRQMESDPNPLPPRLAAVLASPHETRGDRPTYWPGRWVINDSIVRSVEPLIWRGSSDLLALGLADGLIHFPRETNLHQAGAEVQFFPFLR